MVTHVYTEDSPFNILLINYLLLYNGKANKNECFKYAQASFVTRYIVQGRTLSDRILRVMASRNRRNYSLYNS